MSLFRKVTLLCALCVLLVLSACGSSATSSTMGSANGSSSTTAIPVVAAENFYGDIIKQIGGNHVDVMSILSDPSIDPHTYESNINTAKAVSRAKLVIENSGGYDGWMDKLLAASPNSDRLVIKGFDLAPTRLTDNEHVWYNVDNMAAIAQVMSNDLKKLDPADAATFESNMQAFKQSLEQVHTKVSEIKAKYNGSPVGLTETIYLYQTQPLGLKVLTPFEFQKALAEGNDPPADTVVTAENQVKGKQIKVLIYNEQTVSPVTTKLQNDARAVQIPIIPVTETMPANKHYQSWMLDQLGSLEHGLGGK